MSPPNWLNLLVTVSVVAGLIYLLILLARRVWLGMMGGLFDCAVRRQGATKWRPGLARYSGPSLEWYLIWHPLPLPSRIFLRAHSELISFRDSDAFESTLGYATSKIVGLRVLDESPEFFELAMNEGSAMGLVSWLESAPPGEVGYRRSRNG